MLMPFLKYVLSFLLVSIAILGCFRMRASKGGGEIKPVGGERQIDVKGVALPEGYQIELVAQGLIYPTGIDFDEAGNPYVVESGYAYGEEWTVPTLKKIEADGSTTIVARGDKNGPWNGVAFHEGKFILLKEDS